MTVDVPHRAGLTLSGKPMSSPLRNVRSLARQMVDYFVENVAVCGTLPGDAISGDITAITRTNLEFAVAMLDGQNIPAQTKKLEAAAAQWAREGVPIDTIQHAIHEGFLMGLDLVVSGTAPRRAMPRDAASEGPIAFADYENLLSGTRLVVEMLDTMTTTISKAYVRELRAVVSEHHTAVHTLTSALLAGKSTSTMARECGIEILDAYVVLAVSIPPHHDERNPLIDGKVVARRKLRRMQARLADLCEDTALSLLSVDGGTILLPADSFDAKGFARLIAELSGAARTPITAALVEASLDAIPDAADQAHELLDMVARLHCEPGLYRFDDLALEYQLTRPGPGREYLGGMLDPLDEHPELLQTLQVHIANNLHRARTARMLHIHANTIDYRLKRIGQLTGFDPTEPSGLWYLRSALVARSYQTSPQRRGQRSSPMRHA
ncbi:helix-turn-helix domain-containing protein [Nocardia sp. NPDC046763]|uniref:PucR family transcriptional regulator n=1 Tax=Nocardia sp. NPDC046763 TaxID=3155256 RepID=UPI0033CFEA19